ncbi:MAG: type II secretion system secretin GspD [Parvularcula sp.]
MNRVVKIVIGVLGVGGLSLGIVPAHAQQDRATLNYEGADLAAVARDVAFRTNRIFVIDPRLSGRVSIVSPPDLTLSPDEVWEVFLSTLQVSGFAAVPIGDREYKIVPVQNAIKDGGTAGSGETVTRVIPLRFIDARTAATNLRGLIGDNAIVTPISESNALVIVDTGSNVQRVINVLSKIDVDNSIVRTIPLKNVAASEVANTIAEILSGQGGDQAQRSVNVVPVDATNSIIVRGSADEVARLIPVINRLDATGAARSAIDLIYLNHADGEQVVPIIQQLLDGGVGQAAGATASPTTSSVAFHKPTNSLIINAPPDLQQTIRSIVARLDIRRPQVQIEAVVVEISNTTARELGVQYVSGGDNIPVSAASFTGTSPNIISAAGAAYFLGPGSKGRTRTVTRVVNGVEQITEEEVFDTNNPSTAVAGQLVDAAVGELLNFNGFLVGAADQSKDGSVYGVLLSAIRSDTASNVLSVPSVTLLDNETASLGVGQEIPIVTGQASGADFQNSFRTIERKDVGNILEVTPQINAGNTIQLKVRLEISSIGAFTSLTDDIITNKSTIETVALAEDGQTLVIGGLIDNDRRNTESKVPVLGDVPVLGNLFKGQTRQQEDKTLMVFIRPTILRDSFSADAVTARKYDHVRTQQLRKSRGQEALIDQIMTDYLGPGDYVRPAPPPPRTDSPTPEQKDAP